MVTGHNQKYCSTKCRTMASEGLKNVESMNPTIEELQRQIDILRNEIEALNDRFDKYLTDKLKAGGYKTFPSGTVNILLTNEEKAKKYRTNW